MGSYLSRTPWKVLLHWNRTDNCVKNHFYSCFRKGIKIVNSLINSNFKKKMRPIKLGIVNKIVSVIEAYHKEPESFDKEAYQQAKCNCFPIQKSKWSSQKWKSMKMLERIWKIFRDFSKLFRFLTKTVVKKFPEKRRSVLNLMIHLRKEMRQHL